ncbi:MAG: hypothetical protein FWF96_03255 [Kiritimatiellaeota bacterium]|nr:hypothetical protein [Kiritimatiellota bacterium]
MIVFGDKTHCSFPRQLRRAEIVVADAGGSAVLASEAAKVLELALANEGNNDFLLFRELPSISPVLHRARQSLPHDASLWAVKKPRRHYASTNSQPRLRGMEIPAHVVIRYGTHSTYVWMLVFPPGNTLPELPDGVAHVEGTVYLSKRNL